MLKVGISFFRSRTLSCTQRAVTANARVATPFLTHCLSLQGLVSDSSDLIQVRVISNMAPHPEIAPPFENARGAFSKGGYLRFSKGGMWRNASGVFKGILRGLLQIV